MNPYHKNTLWSLAVLVLAVSVFIWVKDYNIEAVKVGVIAPITGARADAGEFTQNALILAREKLASDSQRKVPIEFVTEDSKYEPPTAVSAFRKLTDLENIRFIIGPYGSSEVMAVGPVAEQSQVVLLVTGAQSDEISSLGDYIFRVIHHSSQEAPIFAPFVASEMKSDIIHFLALNTAITEPYLKAFLPQIQKLGKKVGLIEKFDAKAVDFKTHLLKIKAQKPTDLFLIATPKIAGMILKQANELGLKVQFYNIGVEGPELLTGAGVLAEGLFYPYSYDPTVASPRVADFYSSYKTRFGTEPDAVAANVFDSVMLLSDCFEKVGTETNAVKQCLYQTKDFDGVGGRFSIDANGDAIKTIIIKTVEGGRFVKYQ